MRGPMAITRSDNMVCPFCRKKRMFNCARVARRNGEFAIDELAAWRCYDCSVKILVTNFSYLPGWAKVHADGSVTTIDES